MLIAAMQVCRYPVSGGIEQLKFSPFIIPVDRKAEA